MAIRVLSIEATTAAPGAIIASATAAPNAAVVTLSGAHIQDSTPITVFNGSSTTILLGGSTMTTVTSAGRGLPLASSASMSLNLMAGDVLFALATGTTGHFLTVFSGRQ